ncbi:fructosamine kinase family protein [Actinomyces sp. B33]|uniref:fructosamine kinase family protein n=1 Tax=Actinomyces sp. B33 TaxID=2942131 RepID=UPI002375CCA7|nr:fructosamine kinase family protein [Actinomyces sp. B33]
MERLRKTDPTPSRISHEAHGLAWLADSGPGAARVVPVLDRGPTWIDEPLLTRASPTPRAAEDFGRALARTHAAGATHLGAPPPGHHGDGWMGDAPLTLPPSPDRASASWGEFYATERIAPYLDCGAFAPDEARAIDRLCDRLCAGGLDHDQPGLVAAHGALAARTHGDLWSGNVMWTPDGTVLIDPAAQGGHAEEDLAALAVFGCPHLERIIAAYDEASPLADGWRERTGLHQLHILIVHCALFGRAYAADLLAVVRRFA